MAQKKGVRVVLDGYDGDTTVSHGTGYFNQLKQEGRWLKLVWEVKAYADKNGIPWRKAVRSWIKHPLRSTFGISHLLRARTALRDFFGDRTEDGKTQSATPVPRWRKVLNESFVREIESKLEPEDSSLPDTERVSHYEQLTRAVMVETPELLDAVGAGAGVEVRYPFFDRRLVEFCLALPPEQKLRNGWSRMVMRRAMEGILPASIQWRPGKADLSHSFEYSLVNYGRLHLEQLMHENPGQVYRYVDHDYVKRAVSHLLDGRMDGSKDEINIIWKSLSLALWLQYTSAVEKA